MKYVFEDLQEYVPNWQRETLKKPDGVQGGP